MEYDPVSELGLILNNMMRMLGDGYHVDEFDVERALEHYNAIVELMEKKNNE